VVLAVAFSGDLRKYPNEQSPGTALLSAPPSHWRMPAKMAMRWAKSVAGASEKDAPELTRNQAKFFLQTIENTIELDKLIHLKIV